MGRLGNGTLWASPRDPEERRLSWPAAIAIALVIESAILGAALLVDWDSLRPAERPPLRVRLVESEPAPAPPRVIPEPPRPAPPPEPEKPKPVKRLAEKAPPKLLKPEPAPLPMEPEPAPEVEMPALPAPPVAEPAPPAAVTAAPAPPVEEKKPPRIREGVVPKFQVKPRYPPRALRAGITGRVMAHVTIGPGGTVAKVEIVSAEPRGLFERAAEDALYRWRFQPEAAGEIVAVPVEFNLDR